MSATPLATARADAVIVRAAARALQRGDRADEVARFLAVYAGLPLVDRDADAWADFVAQRIKIMRVIAPTTPRRRWWSRWT